MPRRHDDDYDDDDYEDDEDDYEDDDDRHFRRRRDIGDDAGIRMLLPVGRSGWAVAAGYLGLVSILLVPAPFALVTGILALREMRRNPRKHGMGRAMFGIIMGAVCSVFLVLILVGIVASTIKHQ